MTTDLDTHPYRYHVTYTWRDSRGEHTGEKEMAFTGPRDVSDIQALDASITVTSVETA